MRRSLLLAALSLAAAAADCGFGGERVSPALCRCRPEWRGQNCTQLSLLPAPNPFAFSNLTAPFSSWGGSVLPAPRGGFVMAVAEMALACGLDSWESNSEITIATAPTQHGPFTPRAVLLAPFAHNPTLHRLLNGSLIVAHIGQGRAERPLITNCSGGVTPPASGAPPPPPPPALPALGVRGTPLPPPNFLLLASGDPSDGSPWVEVNSAGGAWAANNPALWIDPADGSALLVYKVGCPCPPPCAFCRQFGVATAGAWGGAFTDQGLIPVYGEDAYVWRDPAGVANGGYHMLFQGGSYAPSYPQ